MGCWCSMSNQVINECPFCGACPSLVFVVDDPSDSDDGIRVRVEKPYRMICEECGTLGSAANRIKDAIDEWNKLNGRKV
jgi:hypothetical protein